ncbi:protein kinase [Streptomyces smyrnaeus]|uniref:non-specific serine/threonine protein kinase n=1 Tax=Streptomyces smyrnaeus TaxID=1387713 RepID=A0ABS3XVW0_9ACTN|nr:protein kinase [Streptomyces smyrnaeus]MBO8199206.1 protein kinase [Streptomyces smyrnaeus]
MRGRRLQDRYELLELLGTGGMGEVWRAGDLRLGREVAVKVFMPQRGVTDGTDRDELLARFHREARSAAALDCPHIVTVHDHGTDSGTPFLVMALVHGTSLHEVLRDTGRVPLTDALRWTADVCRALESAHTAGVVHRDIKPANIMVEGAEGDSRAKVVDFGIAKFVEARSTDPRLTTTGRMPFGSVLYMAPEQFRQEGVDGRTDLYALGCVLYELLVGRPPYTGSAAGVMFNHLHDVPLRPSRARPELPACLDRLVLDLMARDPTDRPTDAARALERIRDVARAVRENESARVAPGRGAAPAREGEPGPHVEDRRPASSGLRTPYHPPQVPAPRRGVPTPTTPSTARRVWCDPEWTPTAAQISRLIPDRGRRGTVLLPLAGVLIVVVILLTR